MTGNSAVVTRAAVREKTAAEPGGQASTAPGQPAADPPPEPPPPSPAGFTLAFESTGALERLMDAGRVTLFALGDRQYWAMQGSRLQAAEPPSRYYRMDAATVPLAWQRLAAAVSGSTEIAWGVSLPPDITAAIAGHTRGAGGGEILIHGSGEVVLGQRRGSE